MSTHRPRIIAFTLAALIAATVFALPVDLDTTGRVALSLVAIAALFWTLEPVPVEYTALLLLALLPISGVVLFEQAFAAFSGKAVWLVFSGMSLSLLITETGIGARLTGWVLRRVGRLSHLLIALHAAGLVAALLVPSGVVRVLILMPILVALLDALDEPPGSRVSAAVVLSAVCATYYGGTGILTASVPNLVVMGVLEDRGHDVFWGQWAFYVLPVLGVARVAVTWGIIRLVFRIRGNPVLEVSEAVPSSAPLQPEEVRAWCILLAGVILWATDVVHGIHPVHIGLGLVLVAFLPGLGPLKIGALRKLNFPVLIYIGALFAVGEALSVTGVSERLAALVPEVLRLADASTAVRAGAFAAAVTPLNFAADTAVIAGVLTPILLDAGNLLGMTGLQIGLSVAVGAGIVFLPYQAAPFMVAHSFGRVRMGQFALVMALVAAVSILVLIPLNILYWRLVGFV